MPPSHTLRGCISSLELATIGERQGCSGHLIGTDKAIEDSAGDGFHPLRRQKAADRIALSCWLCPLGCSAAG